MLMNKNKTIVGNQGEDIVAVKGIVMTIIAIELFNIFLRSNGLDSSTGGETVALIDF